MTKPIVDVQHVVKSFRIPLEGSNGLKQKLVNQLKGRKGYRVFTPLDDISFTVEEGDFFGIVGKNGSGKSTLLKTLAGIYSPQSGGIAVEGSIVPFIELGVGFNPELSGRENIYLNGALLGFSKKEIDLMYDDIVSFAELGEFMDERLKNYSSGMQVRLAFSIAIQAKGDVLLLDEVLAVGDAAFQQKCFDYFELLKREKKTIIIVTHDMSAVKRFCNKAILIENGKIKLSGSPQDIADAYLIDNFDAIKKTKKEKKTERVNETQYVSKLHMKSANKKVIIPGEELKLSLGYTIDEAVEVEVRIAIEKEGISFAHVNTRDKDFPSKKGSYEMTVSIDTLNFLDGIHDVYWGVFNKESGRELAFLNKSVSFFIKRHEPTKYGLMFVRDEWSEAVSVKQEGKRR